MPEIELISDLNVGDADGITPDGVTLVYKTTHTEFNDDGGSCGLYCRSFGLLV